MAWVQQNVTITQDSDRVCLQVGPEGYSFPKDYLRAIWAGDIKDPMMLLTQICIGLKTAGVDVTKPVQVKNYVEGRTWAW